MNKHKYIMQMIQKRNRNETLIRQVTKITEIEAVERYSTNS